MKPIMARLSLLFAISITIHAGPIYIASQDVTTQPGTNNQIGLINPLTGVVTGAVTMTNSVGGGQVQMFDIAMDLLGDVWGIDSTFKLWQINPTTGVSTEYASILNGSTLNANGMVFDPITGDVYLSTFGIGDPTTRLRRFNIATDCVASVCTTVEAIAPVAPPNASGGDIAFLNGYLYYASVTGDLYRLEQDAPGVWKMFTGGTNTATPLVGGIGVTVKGLGADDGKLYASVTVNPAVVGFGTHAILEIDPVTLAVLSTSPITGILNNEVGLASNPTAVPEPSVMIPFALALAFFLRRVRGGNRMTPYGEVSPPQNGEPQYPGPIWQE